MRAHSIVLPPPFAFEPISPNAICYSGVSGVTADFDFDSIFNFIQKTQLFSVCLKNLNDHGNAYLAFERSAMLPDAIKNPLIYLNFAIYCWRTKRFEQAAANLDNFFNVAKSIPMRPEFMNAAIKLKQFLPPAIQAEQEDPPTTPIPTELSPKTAILSANPVEEGSGETMDDSQTSRDMLI